MKKIYIIGYLVVGGRIVYVGYWIVFKTLYNFLMD